VICISRHYVSQRIEAVERSGFTGRPGIPEPLRPVRPGRQQGEPRQRERRRQFAGELQCRRDGTWHGRLALRTPRLPVRRKHLERRATSGKRPCWWIQPTVVEPENVDATRQAPPDLVLKPSLSGLVTSRKVECGGVCLRDEFGDDLRRIALANHECRSTGTDALVQSFEASVQPPAAGAACIVGIAHVNGNHRAPRLGGGDKRGVVGQTKVTAEPDDEGLHCNWTSLVSLANPNWCPFPTL